MTNKTGGPAFPSEQGECQDGTWNQTYDSGMSLRDYFAGQALMGLCANPREDYSATTREDKAVEALRQAAALLKAREES